MLTRLLRVVLVMVFVVASSCDRPAEEATKTPGEQAALNAPATGLDFQPPPNGYVVRAAIDGTGGPEWTSDTSGGTHPTVVLVPQDWSGVDDITWVTIESYDGSGNQGGAFQELPIYSSPDDAESFEVNGYSAVGADIRANPREPEKGDSSAFVAVDTSGDRGSKFGNGDYGYMVSGPNRSLDELMEFANAVTAAEVHEPVELRVPPGWRVLGALSGFQIQQGAFGDGAWYVQTGGRAVLLHPTNASDNAFVKATSLPGTNETAKALAIAATWTRGGSRPPSPIIQHGDGEHTWFTVPERSSLAYATFEEKPMAISVRDELPDEEFVAELLNSIVITTDDEWDELVASIAPNVTRARPGSELVATGRTPSLEWAIEMLDNANQQTPPPSDPPTGLLDPRAFFSNTSLIVQLPQQSSVVAQWSRIEPLYFGRPPNVRLLSAMNPGELPGWLLCVQAPKEATQAVLNQDGTTHTFELFPWNGSSIGAVYFDVPQPDDVGEVRLLAADGSDI